MSQIKTKVTTLETSKEKKDRVDRSQHKYSEKDFMNMDREQQVALAIKFWGGKVESFDDEKTFKFSYTHLASLCQKLGIEKGVYDSHKKKELKIVIDKDIPRDTIVRKYSFDKKLCNKIDELFGELGNVDKSIVLEIILNRAIDEVVEMMENKKFSVIYPAKKERILM